MDHSLHIVSITHFVGHLRAGQNLVHHLALVELNKFAFFLCEIILGQHFLFVLLDLLEYLFQLVVPALRVIIWLNVSRHVNSFNLRF